MQTSDFNCLPHNMLNSHLLNISRNGKRWMSGICGRIYFGVKEPMGYITVKLSRTGVPDTLSFMIACSLNAFSLTAFAAASEILYCLQAAHLKT